MLELAHKIDECAATIRSKWSSCRDGAGPRVGIILGTGLGNFAQSINTETTISYEDLPHFPRSTAVGHKGQLVCGTVSDVSVITMEGRFHRYEGYSLSEITLPVRVMKKLGVELLIVSNASGGLNPNYQSGDIVIIDDHINLMFDNPLFGVNDDELGPRFPDMSAPYDATFIERAAEIARQKNFVAHRGVYVALTGPNYETRAEYRFLRGLGGDMVGMSTVPEVIVAKHMNLPVLALSAITNVCKPDVLTPTDGEEVVESASAAEPKMREIVLGILAGMNAA